MAQLVISYRRADTEMIAGRILERLTARYGEQNVFMDIDNIPFGVDFRGYIENELIGSHILLALVGNLWLGPTPGGDAFRIDDENDFVRIEIDIALQNRIFIIPILIGSAIMPKPEQLPDSIRRFAFLNAASLSTGHDFNLHMERLVRSIDATLEQCQEAQRQDEQERLKREKAEAKRLTQNEPKASRTARRRRLRSLTEEQGRLLYSTLTIALNASGQLQ